MKIASVFTVGKQIFCIIRFQFFSPDGHRVFQCFFLVFYLEHFLWRPFDDHVEARCFGQFLRREVDVLVSGFCFLTAEYIFTDQAKLLDVGPGDGFFSQAEEGAGDGCVGDCDCSCVLEK